MNNPNRQGVFVSALCLIGRCGECGDGALLRCCHPCHDQPDANTSPVPAPAVTPRLGGVFGTGGSTRTRRSLLPVARETPGTVRAARIAAPPAPVRDEPGRSAARAVNN